MPSPRPMPKPRSSAALLSSLLLGWTYPALAVDKPAKEEAAAISQVASAKHQAGEFGLCADLFHQAYDKDPTYLPYLFSAARCRHKKGDLDAAERDYRQFLARSPKGGQFVDKAQEYLDQLLAERKKLPVEPVKGPEPVKSIEPVKAVEPAAAPTPTLPAAPPPALSGAQWAGWAAVGAGALLAGAGAWKIAQASADKADLSKALEHPNATLILGIDPATAQQRDDAWRSKMTLGAVLAGVGAATLGGGLFLATRAPVQVAIGVDRVMVAWRW